MESELSLNWTTVIPGSGGTSLGWCFGRAIPVRASLLYVVSEREIRVKRLDALVRHGHLDQTTADKLKAADNAQYDADLAAHAQAGGHPVARLGTRPGWSGLSDQEKSRRFGLHHWYDLYYRPFSNAIHVDAASINNEASRVATGAIHLLGPRFESPWLVVVAAAEAVNRAAHQMDQHYVLGVADRLVLAATVMDGAIQAQTALEAQAFRGPDHDIFGGPLADGPGLMRARLSIQPLSRSLRV